MDEENRKLIVKFLSEKLQETQENGESFIEIFLNLFLLKDTEKKQTLIAWSNQKKLSIDNSISKLDTEKQANEARLNDEKTKLDDLISHV